MERRRRIIGFLACWTATCSLAFGISGSWNGVAITAWNGVAQTSWNGTGVSQAAGGGPSYLVKQDFEGVGYDNGETWTESGTGGTVDSDYTTTVLDGSQSLQIVLAASARQTATIFAPAQSDVWAYYLLRVITLPSASVIITRFLSGGTEGLRVRMTTSGTLEVRAGGGTVANTAATLATGTTYHLWLHYTKGTGANAVASVAFSTTGVRPTSGTTFATSTNGTATVDVSTFALGTTTSGTINLIFDKVRVDDELIGDNPS